MSKAAAACVARSPSESHEDLVTFRAMASDVALRVIEPNLSARDALARARRIFERVELTCTRFDPDSSLMRANAATCRWSVVEPECYFAIQEAFGAYQRTRGAFDPRVLRMLVAQGYDQTLHFRPENPAANQDGVQWREAAQGTAIPAPWQPEFDPGRMSVRIGPDPIDLGGIGKGLAVRWAAEELREAGSAFLVEAGGDCYAGGCGPEGQGWRVGVEDPFGGSDPCAVLQISDLACATSSIRIRRWQIAGRTVHHLFDPRTGAPGGFGLQAATVVGREPAESEVWSKSLFLAGTDGIADLAAQTGLAALWVTDDRKIGFSPAIEQHVIWRRFYE